jgi:hypothetical protein
MSPQSSIQEVISPERLIALELHRAIARKMDGLTQEGQDILAEIGDTGLTNAQINGLLNSASTSDTVTAITRFLEKQGSRRPAWQHYAEKLILFIRAKLLEQAKQVAQEVKTQVSTYHDRKSIPELEALTDPRKRLPEVHLLLTREFVQSFATGYLYNYGKNKKNE